jgi:glyoxylase-like metal-dependent hydrolase (beta-lactamase superfamily II)
MSSNCAWIAVSPSELELRPAQSLPGGCQMSEANRETCEEKVTQNDGSENSTERKSVGITLHNNVTISLAESRTFLHHIGIAGEILATPGHSPDSVSLLLDDGSAFTDELTPPELAGEDDAGVIIASWRLLRERGATRVYPGHGPARRFIEKP